LVLFLSRELDHEVLKTYADRAAVVRLEHIASKLLIYMAVCLKLPFTLAVV
jgi:hypothetical protein